MATFLENEWYGQGLIWNDSEEWIFAGAIAAKFQRLYGSVKTS